MLRFLYTVLKDLSDHVFSSQDSAHKLEERKRKQGPVLRIIRYVQTCNDFL